MQGVIQAIRGTHHVYVDDTIMIAGKKKISPKCDNGEKIAQWREAFLHLLPCDDDMMMS